MSPRTWYTALVVVWGSVLGVVAAGPQTPPKPTAPTAPDRREWFEAQIRPVLAANCFDCHGDAPAPSAGLRLDSRDAMLKGGRSGPAIVPGDPDKSLLIQAVRQSGALKMPKGGKLTPAEVDALVQWVSEGAAWPTFASTPSAAVTSVGKSTSTAATSAYVIKPEQRAFWSFQPIHASPAPTVTNAAWPRTDIDRFVLAKLER